MNKIQRPNVNDINILRELSDNKSLASHPKLKRAVPVVERAYIDYVNNSGNVELIRRTFMDGKRAQFFRDHFKRPPKNLAHISSMRRNRGHLCCAMCGSMHSGTLDHVLPKDEYPEFAVFSANLVPACICNSKRGSTALGAPGQRVLHPYFDGVLASRIVAAKFSDFGPVPKVEIEILLPDANPDWTAVEFHVRTVLERTAAKRYLADRWSAFFRRPSTVVRILASNPASHFELLTWLNEELDNLDDYHQSKNNWNSMFVAGLLNPGASVWLFNRLSLAGRLPGGGLM